MYSNNFRRTGQGLAAQLFVPAVDANAGVVTQVQQPAEVGSGVPMSTPDGIIWLPVAVARGVVLGAPTFVIAGAEAARATRPPLQAAAASEQIPPNLGSTHSKR